MLKAILLEKGRTDIKPGFPRLFEFGNENGYNYTTMGIYGPNLMQLLKLCGGKFGKRTTHLIGLQILDRIQVLH